jgi:glycosyltransferase involved in cell wall biosynthesis
LGPNAHRRAFFIHAPFIALPVSLTYMKILIAHNAYQHRGGEDVVVDAEISLLRANGHDVVLYQRHNDELESTSRPAAAISAIWARRSADDISSLCDSFRPDLIHVHNTVPLISPSLYWAAARWNVPVVQTLHNFRLLCPQAMLLRDGKVCEDCVGKVPWRAISHKCYRDSALQSAVLSGMLATHRMLGTYSGKVTRYIALNGFCRDKFIQGGLPADLIRIKPNFVAADKTPTWENRRGGVFVGRLSFEKGLDVLIDAVAKLGASPVRIIGQGPLKEKVQQAFGGNYLGSKTPDQVLNLLHSAQFLVAPSTCYETFGLVAIEAFACGTPVIASRHGGLGELIDDGGTGLLVSPGDASDLAEKIAWAQAHPMEMLRMGQAAHAQYEKKYTPSQNYNMLIDIYQDAIAAAKGVRHAA